MAKSLKAQNAVSLIAIYAGTFVVLASVQWGAQEVAALSAWLAEVGAAAAMTSFAGIVSNLLPNSAKHVIVFLRLRHMLPGYRCKTICKDDPRFRMHDLEQRWPELFAKDMEESDQNSYWYKYIYAPVQDAPQVVPAHRSFLLYRDALAGLTILLVCFLVWRIGAVYLPIQYPSTWTLLVLLAVNVVVGQAARQSGNRMVANAVAARLVVGP